MRTETRLHWLDALQKLSRANLLPTCDEHSAVFQIRDIFFGQLVGGQGDAPVGHIGGHHHHGHPREHERVPGHCQDGQSAQEPDEEHRTPLRQQHRAAREWDWLTMSGTLCLSVVRAIRLTHNVGKGPRSWFFCATWKTVLLAGGLPCGWRNDTILLKTFPQSGGLLISRAYFLTFMVCFQITNHLFRIVSWYGVQQTKWLVTGLVIPDFPHYFS